MARREKGYAEDKKIRHNVFDEFTNRALYKLMSEGYFEGLQSPLFIGKESNIFTAKTKDDSMVIVKIYRLESCDFNRMFDYIKDDPRYLSLKKRKRNIIFAWVQREYRNLMLARELNVAVPLPLAFSSNILVLECITSGDQVASKLKDDRPKNPQEFFEKTLLYIRRLYDGGLIHADLSPFNILNRDDQPVFIDFSQATQKEASRSEEYLKRDIRNIAKFFQGLKVDADEDKMLAYIVNKQNKPSKRGVAKKSPNNNL